MTENLFIPPQFRPYNYWGNSSQIPEDRNFTDTLEMDDAFVKREMELDTVNMWRWL